VSAKNEHGLTPKQEQFALAVAGGMGLSAAYRDSYRATKMKPETVNDVSSKLMASPQITQRVRQLQAQAAVLANLNAADILLELKKLAHSDIANIMDDAGRVKMPHQLDAQTRAAIASFKVDEAGNIEYKFWPKNNAIDMAMKHLGLYERDNDQAAKKMIGVVQLVALGPL
jgi:phage terminase small subunit